MISEKEKDVIFKKLEYFNLQSTNDKSMQSYRKPFINYLSTLLDEGEKVLLPVFSNLYTLKDGKFEVGWQPRMIFFTNKRIIIGCTMFFGLVKKAEYIDYSTLTGGIEFEGNYVQIKRVDAKSIIFCLTNQYLSEFGQYVKTRGLVELVLSYQITSAYLSKYVDKKDTPDYKDILERNKELGTKVARLNEMYKGLIYAYLKGNSLSKEQSGAAMKEYYNYLKENGLQDELTEFDIL